MGFTRLKRVCETCVCWNSLCLNIAPPPPGLVSVLLILLMLLSISNVQIKLDWGGEGTVTRSDLLDTGGGGGEKPTLCDTLGIIAV